MAERNERNFSSEQIRRNRDAVIGLQAGTNIGATQVPPVCCERCGELRHLVDRVLILLEQQAHRELQKSKKRRRSSSATPPLTGPKREPPGSGPGGSPPGGGVAGQIHA